ncbi:MAG: hypothetical protein ACAI35_23755 [Candidatus Methylacidiphilales bacterium]|nr:hypothetical protein [Candidatus Methylacidiphilales bacterium]
MTSSNADASTADTHPQHPRSWRTWKSSTLLVLSGIAWFVAHVVVELIAHMIIGLPVFGMPATV